MSQVSGAGPRCVLSSFGAASGGFSTASPGSRGLGAVPEHLLREVASATGLSGATGESSMNGECVRV